jgi:predicted transcriptional regulator
MNLSTVDDLLKIAISSYEDFPKTLNRIIKEELGMTTSEFAELADIPQSTLYKILTGHREPNIKTLRQIINTIQKIEGSTKQDFIAVIAARPVLDYIEEKKLKIGNDVITVREYSATNMEEAIIAAIRAERDGAKALVCAPIVSPTIEKVLRIPVATIMPKDSLIRAIELAAKKIK